MNNYYYNGIMKKYRQHTIAECPLCGENNAHVINEFNSKIVYDRLPNPKIISFKEFDLILNELWGTDTCHFLECQTCKLCYSNPFVPGDVYYYNLIYSDNSEYPDWKWDFQISYDFLINAKLIEKLDDMRVLEVGAGNGSFVKKIAEDLTPKENILTTEFSDHGRREIENYGITCENKDLLELETENFKNSFNVICMFQVLEHLGNIELVFNKISLLIKKSGYLLISVPNNKHREIFEKFDFIEDIPPTHISRWNFESYSYLADVFNWEICDFKIQPTDLITNINKFRIHCNKRKLFYKSDKIKYSTVDVLAGKDLGISQWICLKKK